MSNVLYVPMSPAEAHEVFPSVLDFPGHVLAVSLPYAEAQTGTIPYLAPYTGMAL